MSDGVRCEAWRSVAESLPKVGASVLVGYRNRGGYWRSVVGSLARARTIECQCDINDCFCVKDEDGVGWWPEGWVEVAENCYDDVNVWRIDGTVTHWMPLPPPPAQEAP